MLISDWSSDVCSSDLGPSVSIWVVKAILGKGGDSRSRLPASLMVSGEGIEPPTFGLQHRCTTAVLTRPGPHFPRSLRQGQARTSVVKGKRVAVLLASRGRSTNKNKKHNEK